MFTIVIARYNEDLEWLKEARFENHKVICYNKGPNEDFYKHPRMEVIAIPNVGMCNQTYLHHIIQHYDNLDDLTLFLPASCMDCNKIAVTNMTFDYAMHTKNSVFAISQMHNVKETLYNFTLNQWNVSNAQNKMGNREYELVPCAIRPFGKFYETYFGNLRTIGVNYFTIYAVSKAHIRQTPKQTFEALIAHVDKDLNCEAAHYLERLALAMYHPIPHECLISNNL
jgi:hypothetical protein